MRKRQVVRLREAQIRAAPAIMATGAVIGPLDMAIHHGTAGQMNVREPCPIQRSPNSTRNAPTTSRTIFMITPPASRGHASRPGWSTTKAPALTMRTARRYANSNRLDIEGASARTTSARRRGLRPSAPRNAHSMWFTIAGLAGQTKSPVPCPTQCTPSRASTDPMMRRVDLHSRLPELSSSTVPVPEPAACQNLVPVPATCEVKPRLTPASIDHCWLRGH